MYKRFQQIISVSMALLVLFSTLSFSVEKHYCGEHLVDVAIFSDAKKCGMEASDQGLNDTDQNTVLMSNSCCKDVVDLVEGQDELSLEKTKVLDTDQKIFLLSFAYVFGELYAPKTENTSLFKPPSRLKVVKDIHLLHEVFLI